MATISRIQFYDECVREAADELVLDVGSMAAEEARYSLKLAVENNDGPQAMFWREVLRRVELELAAIADGRADV